MSERRRLEPEEYQSNNLMAALVAQTIENLPLEEMTDMMSRAEALAPILDPTLYREKGHDAEIDGRRLRILYKAQRDLKELRTWAEDRKPKPRVRETTTPPPPPDRKQRVLGSGEPVPADESHRALRSDGQQRDYVVLSDGERSKGFVRPVRTTYRHLVCGVVTTLTQKIAETYARDPSFYNATFCVGCRTHLPLDQFVWDGTSLKVGS